MYIKKKVVLSEVIQGFFEDLVQSAAFWGGKSSMSSVLRLPGFIIRTFLTPIVIAVSVVVLLGKLIAMPSFLLFKLVKEERFRVVVKYVPFVALVAAILGGVALFVKFQEKIVSSSHEFIASNSLAVNLTLLGLSILAGVLVLDYFRKNLILLAGISAACAARFFIRDENLWYIPALVAIYAIGTEAYFKDVYKLLSLKLSFIEIVYNKLCFGIVKSTSKDRAQRDADSWQKIVDIKYNNGVFSVYGEKHELLSEIHGDSLVSLTDYTITTYNKSDRSTYTYNAYGDVVQLGNK